MVTVVGAIEGSTQPQTTLLLGRSRCDPQLAPHSLEVVPDAFSDLDFGGTRQRIRKISTFSQDSGLHPYRMYTTMEKPDYTLYVSHKNVVIGYALEKRGAGGLSKCVHNQSNR